MKRCSYKTATTCNRKFLRKLLRSGYTGACPRNSWTFTGLGGTYEWMQGSLNKELFRRAGCFLGQGGPPLRPRPPPDSNNRADSNIRDGRLRNATFRAACVQVRHLLRLSTGWRGIRLRGRLPSSLKCVAALRSDSVVNSIDRGQLVSGADVKSRIVQQILD